MSDETIMDRVRAEADAAEAEDETPEPELEPDEPEQPAEPAPSDSEMEALYGKIERKGATYRRDQAKQLAATGAPFTDCPCCGVAGFVLPYNPADPDEQMRRLVVLDYFDASEPEYKAATDRKECEACDGYGEVLSGSKAAAHRVVPCARCNGTGYVQVLTGLPANGHAPVVAPVLTAEYPPTAPESANPDYWGRPPGHPDYGVLPSLVNAT